MFRHAAVALVVALGLSVAACGGFTDPSNNTMDTFTTTPLLGVGVQYTTTFNVAKNGELTIAALSAAPPIPNSTAFEIGYGISASGQCQPLQVNQFATVGTPAISGIEITSGQYCLFVVDEGLFLIPETLTISVSHP